MRVWVGWHMGTQCCSLPAYGVAHVLASTPRLLRRSTSDVVPAVLHNGFLQQGRSEGEGEDLAGTKDKSCMVQPIQGRRQRLGSGRSNSSGDQLESDCSAFSFLIPAAAARCTCKSGMQQCHRSHMQALAECHGAHNAAVAMHSRCTAVGSMQGEAGSARTCSKGAA